MDIKKYQTGGLLSGPIQSRDYVPLPYAQAFEMSRLTEADRDAKEQNLLGMYKGFYDQAMLAPPGLQDEALAELKPYLDKIDQGLAEAGGDPLKYRGGMDVMKSFYGDMASGRIGSLQRAGSQYAAAKKEYDNLNELYMKGKGGVPEARTNLSLQIALQEMQNAYDSGQPATFSPPSLIPEVDILEKTGDWLSQKEADGFTDAEGNKIEQLTAETLLPIAQNYMLMDPEVRGTITQEIDLNMRAGNFPMENVDMDKILSDKKYAQLYRDAITSMPIEVPEEQAQAVASQSVYRAKLLDDRMNNFAVAAIQPFLQRDVEMKEKDTKLSDIFVGGSGSQRPVVRGEENIANIRSAKDNLLDIQRQRDAYGKGTPQYNELNKQVTFIENDIASREQSLKTYTKDLVTTKYAEVGKKGNENEYERLLGGLDKDERKIIDLLSVADESLFVGTTPLSGATNIPVATRDALREIATNNPEFGINPNDITVSNAVELQGISKELREEVKKIETAKEYEQNIRTLNPDPAKGDQDAIFNLRRQVTDAVIKDAMKFVDPATGADLLSILESNSASLTSIVRKGGIDTPGVEVMPTASFVNGKQLYAVSYHKNKWKEGEPRQSTVYVTEASYSPQDQTNRVNYLAENLLNSTNPANQQMGVELIADNTIGGPIQRSEIEYINADQRGELPGYNYAGEVSYADRPVSGVPGVSTVRRVSVGGGQYDYYILDANGDAYVKGDKSGLLTSRSVLDLGRLINQEYGKR